MTTNAALTRLPQLTLDWLDALLILRRVIDSHDVRWMIEITALGTEAVTSHRAVEIRKSLNYVLTVRLDFAALPKIERVEILTFAACCIWWMESYPGDPSRELPREAFQNLCHRAGCWFTNTSDVRERWRLIDFYTPFDQLPCAVYETRPRCKLCATPVATGSGAWINEDKAGVAMSTMFGLDKKNVRQIDDQWQVYREDLHEECARYIHRVMLPARAAQVEAEKTQTTGSIDK